MSEAVYEEILFSGGMNRKRGPLFLKEGDYAQTARGFCFERLGIQECRPARTANMVIDADGVIQLLRRQSTNVYAAAKKLCPGEQAYFNYIYHRTATGSAYTNVGLMGGSGRPRDADYQDFTFLVDGESGRAYDGANEFEWGLPNPDFAPTVTAGAAGSPNGTYTCYVTYYFTFPNEKIYETGPSSAASITVTSDKIEWTGIPRVDYDTTGLIVWRKLYRTVSGTPYLVTTLNDNTTTSYSDNNTDAVLQANPTLSTTDYDTPPINPVDVALHLQRLFLAKDDKVYWSEAYIPFAFSPTSNAVVTRDNEDLVAILSWGTQLYMGSKRRWYRLLGDDPDTWAVKPTFTDKGPINRDTVVRTRYGIPCLWYEGIQLFDGNTGRSLTETTLGKQFFSDISDLSACWAAFDGRRYYFYFPTTGSTPNSCLVLDLEDASRQIIFEDDFIATAHEYYKEAGTRYLAYGGSEYLETGTESITTSLLSREMAFQNVHKQKALEYLHYDINTGGADVTVTFYVDGVSSYTMTINESSRVRKRTSMLPNLEGYRFSIGIDCTNSSGLYIYEPWALRAVLVGD